MLVDFAEGLFIIVNGLISIYIVVYAFIFLSRTRDYPDRRPWELLFIGAIFFMIGQIITLASIFDVEKLFNITISQWRIFIEFIYATLILLAFVTQSQLILLSDMIIISKKIRKRKQELSDAEKSDISVSSLDRNVKSE